MPNERPQRVSRRRMFGIGAGLLAAGAGAFTIVGGFLRPRNPQGFGAPVTAGNARDYPRGGDPVRPTNLGFWLANLNPDDMSPNGAGGGLGLLACWEKCPHLGSTVDWRPEMEFEGVAGWYRCRSHGGTFTRAGVRVFGPPPRSLDTMRVTVDAFGTITVDTGAITRGASDNARRTVDHPLLPN